MTVPDEAVEAAARAYHHAMPYLTVRESIVEALNVAAPFIAAQAWDEGWDAMADFDHRQAGPYPTNPYRSEQ